MAKTLSFQVMTPEDGHKTIEVDVSKGLTDASAKFNELLAANPGAQAYKVEHTGVKKVGTPIKSLKELGDAEEILIRPAMQGG